MSEKKSYKEFDFEKELKKLPDKPGVYIMHDKNDTIIYVGKAIILKNRVRQYFQKNKNHSSKIKKMVENIAYFEYIVTDSEVEALILECNLIKLHNPKYNTMLKDGKSYPYIKITMGEDYPRVLISRNMKKDKSKYFGPFTNVTALKDILDLLKKTYKIRTCNKKIIDEKIADRPCLNYHIKQCNAPCMKYISKEEYAKNIKETISFLNGNYKELLDMLKNKMSKHSEKLEFEEAAKYRDLYNSANQLVQKQKINNNTDVDDKDYIACAVNELDAVVQVFYSRGGKLIGREHFHMNVGQEQKKEEIINEFIKQFYAETPYLPSSIIIEESIKEKELISTWLSQKKGSKVRVENPKKGKKEKMLELASTNASIVLKQDCDRIKRQEARTKGALKEIADILGLTNIKRVESYDISNISGFLSVGSMVVFEDGKPKKNDYRKFRIKSVVGIDDYASMNEVITRRFEHESSEFDSFSKYPDLIMMDGGKGQVNVCKKVLEKLNINIAVCGMVKDDKHRTRGLYFNDVEMPIDEHSEGFRLITRIQDETHRFAISYHRSLRSKEQIHSVLDDIKGIGSVRKKELMKHFKSIEAIKKASFEDLCKVKSMDKKAASRVIDFFKSESDNANEQKGEKT